MNWRVTAAGPEPDLQLAVRADNATTNAADAVKGARPAYFPEAGGFTNTPIYDRYRLAPGAQFAGPAIVEERESTVIVGPGAKCSIDAHSLIGGGLTKDHIVPIYQGGDDSILNIQPMCRNCNSSKGNDTTDYREMSGMDWKKRLSECLAKRLSNASETATPARVSLPSPIPLKSEIPGADAPLSPAVLPTAPSPEPESTSSEEPGIPACPHQRLLRLFREKVPELPQPRRELWEGSKGADAMRQRWHWLMTAKRDTGDRYATTTDAGIEWMGNFFERVQESDFLCGRSGKWRCDLAWLMQRDNFRKVIEHGYPNKEMA